MMEQMKRMLLTEEQVNAFAAGTADVQFDIRLLPAPYYCALPNGATIVALYPVGDVLAAISKQGLQRVQDSGLLNTVVPIPPEKLLG